MVSKRDSLGIQVASFHFTVPWPCSVQWFCSEENKRTSRRQIGENERDIRERGMDSLEEVASLRWVHVDLTHLPIYHSSWLPVSGSFEDI